MSRSALFLLAICAVAATTAAGTQNKSGRNGDPASFRVKLALSGVDGESIENEIAVIEEGVAADIPIHLSFKQKNGSTIRFTGMRNFVPSPALMANAEPDAQAESVLMGPQLICRIQRAPGGVLLLDATLAVTTSNRHDPQRGYLTAETRQIRSVLPIQAKKPVTLTWPQNCADEQVRRVTITVLASA
jgi:hypothetical protein